MTEGEGTHEQDWGERGQKGAHGVQSTTLQPYPGPPVTGATVQSFALSAQRSSKPLLLPVLGHWASPASWRAWGSGCKRATLDCSSEKPSLELAPVQADRAGVRNLCAGDRLRDRGAHSRCETRRRLVVNESRQLHTQGPVAHRQWCGWGQRGCTGFGSLAPGPRLAAPFCLCSLAISVFQSDAP